ncbi:hypothetical protein DAPPUDRAFT_258980 [Daphnia pulex]|uniref:Endonuclease/exonuclease/phosphatase domain-containing protein n=1 Tax=Daphnia pulex TaxID=6669 RepID=E9HGC9_DAPPU|nr:hypothetical protein DAPPUDRAFT_258980 [Daphnia pulex]|eukprot:EFX69225.1 hypothetical protein DAPPUDRAFT_258980 [Daphnia pulex]
MQWNSRGLTKSRIDEFRSLLNKEDPNLVFLSGTFWNPSFTVKFVSYNLFKKDRSSRLCGGVALLQATSTPTTAYGSPTLIPTTTRVNPSAPLTPPSTIRRLRVLNHCRKRNELQETSPVNPPSKRTPPPMVEFSLRFSGEERNASRKRVTPLTIIIREKGSMEKSRRSKEKEHHRRDKTLLGIFHLYNLNPQDGQRTTWPFMKAMTGNGNNSLSTIPPIKNSGSIHRRQDHHTSSTPENANISLDLFGASTDYPQDETILDPIIASRIANRLPNDINSAFTSNELELALKKTQEQIKRC